MNQKIQAFFNWPSELDESEAHINISWLETKYDSAIITLIDIFKKKFGIKEYEAYLLEKLAEQASRVHTEKILYIPDIIAEQPEYSFDKNKYLDDYCSSMVKAFLYAKTHLTNKEYDQCLEALLTIQYLSGCFQGIFRTPSDAALLENKVKSHAIARIGGLKTGSKYTPLRTQVQEMAKSEMPKDKWKNIPAAANLIYERLKDQKLFKETLKQSSDNQGNIKQLSAWIRALPDSDEMFQNLTRKAKRADK